MTARKLISCVDQNGDLQEKEYYFYLTRDELLELASQMNVGLDDFLEAVIHYQDPNALIDNFRQILHMSVAKRERGRFAKNEIIVQEFIESGAYNALFIDLLRDGAAAAEFFTDILPDDFHISAPAPIRDYTDEELLTMPEAEFRRVAGEDERRWSRRHMMIYLQRGNVA